MNKTDDKTYIAFKGNKIQFEDTELFEYTSYVRLIEGVSVYSVDWKRKLSS